MRRLYLRLGLTPKLVAAFLVVGVVPMIVVAVIALGVSDALRTSAETKQADTAAAAVDTVDRYLSERYGDVQVFASNPAARSMDPRRIRAEMKKMMAAYAPTYTLMVVADRRGQIIAAGSRSADGTSADTAPIIGASVTGDDWFTRSLTAEPGTTTVDDVERDAIAARVFGAEAPEGVTMNFSNPIRDEAGRVVGVWTTYLNWTTVEDVFTHVLERVDEEGTTLTLVSADGRQIAGAGEARLDFGTDIRDLPLTTLAFSADHGIGHGVRDAAGSEAVLAGFQRSEGFGAYRGVGWRMIATTHEEDALAAATSARNEILLVGLLVLLVVGAGALLLARSFSRPIVRLGREMNEIAESADLMRRVPAERGDEIGTLARSFNRLMSHFHDIVREVGESSRRLRDNSEESEAAAGEAGRAAAEIAATISTVAQGTTDQADQARVASDVVSEIARGATEVAARGEAAATAAAEADTTAVDGGRVLDEARRAMAGITEAVAYAGGVVGELGEKGERIGKIVDTIGEIARQTNLLALNAAIEAARAGDQGRGFAVVADEVRKLAEEAAAAAGSITGLVEGIQAESRRAVEAMRDGEAVVESGTERMGAAADAFADIRDRVSRVREEISQVAAASQQLQAGTVEAESAIAGVVTVAQQNAAASEEVAAGAEQTGASSEEVASSAARVQTAASGLAELVARFRVWNPGAPDRRSRIRSLEERDGRDGGHD